jgi:ribA/ribD-fused uncharacterized protein
VIYPTVEHAYQAAKTSSKAEREQIRLASTPGKAKRMGKTVALRPDWELVKVDTMKFLLDQKFSDPVLRMMLLDTWLDEIEETNTWGDVFWGVCNGKGENKLGKLLMDLRGTIRWKL